MDQESLEITPPAESTVAVEVEPAPQERAKRFHWRSFGSFLLIVIAMLMIPISVLFGWARADLIHEDDFVNTFGPVGADPVVQQEVTRIVVSELNDHIDIDAKTDQLSDEASEALDLLREPVKSGTVSVLNEGVGSFVESDLFEHTWQNTLRITHKALVATITAGEAPGAIEIDEQGNVILEVGYVVDDVKKTLVADGLSIAENIPSVSTTVVVGHSDALAFTGVAYRAITAIGFWVPVITFLFLVGGVLLARRKMAGFIGVGVALNFSLRHATGITTTTPSFAELLRERGFPRVLNVRNLASVLDDPVAPLELRDDGELRILYVGTTGRAQGLNSALDAVGQLKRRGVKVSMRIVGSGAALSFLKEESSRRDLPIEFLGRIPHAEVAAHYEWADTSLVHLRNWKPLQYTVPSKLYESLSAGRHVTVAADGEPARIVEETQVGVAVPAMDSDALADAWEHLSKHPELMNIKDQGALWLQARESQQENAEKFADFVEGCASESP